MINIDSIRMTRGVGRASAVGLVVQLVVCFLLSAYTADAFFSWGKKDKDQQKNEEVAELDVASVNEGAEQTRSVHLFIEDKEQAEMFLEQVQQRQLLREDVRVVSRLLEEKQSEFTTVNTALYEKFQIGTNGNYHYDAANMTIYELLPPASAADDFSDEDIPDVTQRVHLKLTDEKQAGVFVRLVALKKVTQDAVVSFRFVIKQKQRRLKNLERFLKDDFQIEPDGDYEYDAKYMILYELKSASTVEE